MFGDSGSSRVRIEKGRLIALGIFFSSVMIIYLIYLFSLQIVKGSEYKVKAQAVARQSIPIPAQRGELFDRNYDMPLVMNIDSFAVDIIPAEIPGKQREEIFAKIAHVLNMPVEEISKKIPPNYNHLYQPIEIKSGVSYNTIAYLSERLIDYPGVTWHNKPIRSYLETGSISHILGYVGDITREELQILYNKGYGFGTLLGKAGIEKQYDMVLRGQDGKQFRTVDVKGRWVSDGEDDEVPPVLGKNIVLTIDRNIQKLCESALGPRIGSVVVLKPATGEILALVSYPWYDPNIFYTQEGAKKFAEYSLDPTFPFLNRALQSAYAPASTFKIVMTTAIIEEEVFPLDKTIDCKGFVELGDRVFRCHKRTGHGRLNLKQALAESCDVYYFTLGREYLGIERIIDYAKKFGLGKITEIDLPGEIAGLVPSPEWKERVFHTKWVGGDTMNISIGQGYLTVTPIQMANMIAMVVNDGSIYKPRLLKEIRDPVSGEVLETIQPEPLFMPQIRRETFKKLKEDMRGVITDGTARVVITTKAVEVAGKTGTGEVGVNDKFHSWFAAYAPYGATDPNDQIIVVVMVEAINEWEWWAPKAADIIFQGIFAHQSYEDAVRTLKPWYLKQE